MTVSEQKGPSLSLCDKREELNCSGWRLRTSEKRYEAKPLKSRFCPVTTRADGQIFNQTLIALSLTLSLRSSMQRLLVKTREIPHFPSPRCVTLSSDTHNVGQWGSLFKGRDTIQFRSADTPPSLSGSVDIV